MLKDPATAQAALQYGTTQGYAPLREKILARAMALDGVKARDLSLDANDVVVTTGSQQLLYMIGELLLDPGDIVITEAPSYFVYHGTLNSIGVRTLQVPMDDQGMDTEQRRKPCSRARKNRRAGPRQDDLHHRLFPEPHRPDPVDVAPRTSHGLGSPLQQEAWRESSSSKMPPIVSCASMACWTCPASKVSIATTPMSSWP